MRNIVFDYLYRDGSNYKKWGQVIFSNPDGLPPEHVRDIIANAFDTGGLFIAHQIRVPEVFIYLQTSPTSSDHCFHEFDSVSATNDESTDEHGRSIVEFAREVLRESNRGWLAFDPSERLHTS